MEKINIYCLSSKNRYPNKKYEFVSQTNIFCGASNLTNDERIELKNDFIFDDFDENISDLNFSFCELTGIYNVWKNYNDDFLGFCHYRRFWNDSEIKNFDKNKIFVPKRDIWNDTVAQQYINHHGLYGISVLDVLTSNNKIPIKKEHFNQMFTMKHIFPYNMFIMNKTPFNTLCEILFESLFSIYEMSDVYIKESNKYQKRFIGFISERIMNIVLNNSEYYLGTADLQEISVYEV